MIISDIDRLGRYAGAIPFWDIVHAFLMRGTLSPIIGPVCNVGRRRIVYVVQDIRKGDQIRHLKRQGELEMPR